MNKATEQKGRLIIPSSQEIVRVENNDNGCYIVPKSENKTVQLQAGSKKFKKIFPIVNFGNVSRKSRFMQYEPETQTEERVKSHIIEAKEIGMKDFRRQAMDPSFADDGETIIYCAGKKPAVGKPAQWWGTNAQNLMPEKNSRVINELEKDVFLGTIIDYLVKEKRYKVKDAWKAVCVDSTILYRNYEDPKRDFDKTGSRPVGKWYDLASTCKIVKKLGASGYMIFGDKSYSDNFPLENATSIILHPNNVYLFSVGEIVCDV